MPAALPLAGQSARVEKIVERALALSQNACDLDVCTRLPTQTAHPAGA